MRYTITLGSVEHSAEILEDALEALDGFIDYDRQSVIQDLLNNGSAKVTSGADVATVVDTMFQLAQRARKAARRLYAKDGEVEFDDGQRVELTEDGYRVKCWVWVEASEAGCEDLDDEADEDNVEAAYIAAAEHSDVTFDETSEASLGDDPGAYVSGWVDVSEYEVQERFSRLVALACRDCGGEPAMFTATVQVTEEEFKQDRHVELAIELAEEDDYEGPFIPFDSTYAEQLKEASDQLEAEGGPTPIDQLDVYGVPVPLNYVVTVRRTLNYDEVDVPVRACGVQAASVMAAESSTVADAHPAGEALTTSVRLAGD